MSKELDGMRLSRRDVMALAGTAAAGALLRGVPAMAAAGDEKPVVANGRIKQSVSKWCFGGFKLEEFAPICKGMGLVGIDLLDAGAFPVLKQNGLICTMTNAIGPLGIGHGLNRKENHAGCVEAMRKAIDQTAEAGFPNIITFSGNRGPGIDDEEGAKNCIEGLKQIASYAEEKKVTVCMELLNSKRNHKGYMCDHTDWGVKVCKGVGSPRIKLLYDIYHMQIQEGDIIATIRENKDYIGHIHTGGVPGRSNIDDTQELYYPAIMKALVDMKWEGYVAHEFIPRGDALTALRQAVKLCDV